MTLLAIVATKRSTTDSLIDAAQESNPTKNGGNAVGIMILSNSPVHRGDIIVHPKTSGWGSHYGTGVDGGFVAHTTPDLGKHVGTLEEFASGLPCAILHPRRTDCDFDAVQKRALWDLGKPYNTVTANCEHDTTFAQTGVASSPTLNGVLAVAIITGLCKLISEVP